MGMGLHGSPGVGQPLRHVRFARPDSAEGHARRDHEQRDRAGREDTQVLTVATVDIACRAVSMVFGTAGGPVPALGDVTLAVARGEFAAVLAPAAAGSLRGD